MRLLILEDDPGVQLLLRELASIEGWEVRYGQAFADVERSLAWAEALLLDMHLPDVDGLSVLARIRERGLDLPVIVVTADPDLRSQAEALGVHAYLTKPFEVPDLLDALGSLRARPSPGDGPG